MTSNRPILFKRPNDNKILAAPAQATGGIKGVIAGYFNLTIYVK